MAVVQALSVLIVILGSSLRVADAALAYADATATVAEGTTGNILTVTPTGTAAGTSVVFSVAATSGGLAWLAVAADSNNCVISVADGQAIDYEDSNLASGKLYVATVTASEKADDNSEAASDTFEVTLTITDVLDFTGLTHTIKENVAGGAAVGTVVAAFAGTYAYSISSQSTTPGWMEINSASGALTVVSGQTVDYEESSLTNNQYKVVVVATKSDNSESATGTVVITLTDTDDFASGLTASVLTGTASATVVTTLTTTPAASTVALVSQDPNLSWFELSGKEIKVAPNATVSYDNTGLGTGKTYLIVLTVGTGATQGTGTATISITQNSGAAASVGNAILALVSLLLVKLAV